METVKNLIKHLLSSLLAVVIMLGLIKTDIISIEKEVRPSITETSPVVKSTNLQDIAEAVIPSVVTIQSTSGEGSGVILDEEGYIITNAHVIEGAREMNVVTHDGTSLKAELIGQDTQSDLALIKVKGDNLVPASFGKSEELRIADQVLAVGNPGGLKFSSTVTVGHISALNRNVRSGNTSISFIQTDTAINPGNSGGALVNTKGEVIGINTSKIVAEGYEGMGFSIPIDYVLNIIEDIKANGYVKNRATIGISAQYINEQEAQMYNIQSGIYVHEVLSDNAKKVLQERDIIVSFDDTKITSLAHLAELLRDKKPNDTVKLEVYRDHKLINLEIVLTTSE